MHVLSNDISNSETTHIRSVLEGLFQEREEGGGGLKPIDLHQ